MLVSKRKVELFSYLKALSMLISKSQPVLQTVGAGYMGVRAALEICIVY